MNKVIKSIHLVTISGFRVFLADAREEMVLVVNSEAEEI